MVTKECLRASRAEIRSLHTYIHTYIHTYVHTYDLKYVLGVLVEQRGDEALGILGQLAPHRRVHLQIGLHTTPHVCM